MGGGWPTPCPGRITPGNDPVPFCIGAWVCPRAGLDRCRKSRPHRNSVPGPSKPIASRCTDWALPTYVTLLLIRQLQSLWFLHAVYRLLQYRLAYRHDKDFTSNELWFDSRQKGFYLLRSARTGSGAYPVFQSMGAEALLLGIMRLRHET